MNTIKTKEECIKEKWTKEVHRIWKSPALTSYFTQKELQKVLNSLHKEEKVCYNSSIN